MSDKVTVKVSSESRRLVLKSKTGNNSVEQEPIEEVMQKQNAIHYQRGYDDGRMQTKKELENLYTQKLLEKFNELHLIFSDFDERVVEYEKAFEKLVVSLSLQIAEKIIKREVENKSTIEKNLKDSLKKIIGANGVMVHLSPADYDQLINDNAEILKEGTYSKMKFEKDERIENGGCFIETEIGNVDSRISTQLNEIRKQLETTYAEETE